MSERCPGRCADGDDDAGLPTAGGPTLPYGRAFVVQFTAETDLRRGHAAGRIEHLQTGRRSRFASLDELTAGLAAFLAGGDVAPPERRRSIARGRRRESLSPGSDPPLPP